MTSLNATGKRLGAVLVDLDGGELEVGNLLATAYYAKKALRVWSESRNVQRAGLHSIVDM